MKSEFESPEAMAAYTTIDVCYLALEKLMAANVASKNASAMERAIDAATGKTAADISEWTSEAKELIEEIIANKKFIGAATEGDEAALYALRQLFSTP